MQKQKDKHYKGNMCEDSEWEGRTILYGVDRKDISKEVTCPLVNLQDHHNLSSVNTWRQQGLRSLRGLTKGVGQLQGHHIALYPLGSMESAPPGGVRPWAPVCINC